MNSKLFLVIVVFAMLALLAPTMADPGMGLLGMLKEGADEVLSMAGLHNEDANDVHTA